MYPNHEWNRCNFYSSSGTRSNGAQLLLGRMVRALFPAESEVHAAEGGGLLMNDRRRHRLLGVGGERKLELDIYLPALKLGFEYQALQSYHALQY